MYEIIIEVEDAETKAKGWECPNCENIEFEEEDAEEIIKELSLKELAKKSDLSREHEIVPLPDNKVGICFKEDIVRYFDLKPGKKVYVYAPDNKNMIISIT